MVFFFQLDHNKCKILLPQSQIVIVICLIASHVFKHFDKRREVDGLLLTYSLGLHDGKADDGRKEGVDLEELSFPNETLTPFHDGLTVGVSLLEHLLIQIIVDFSFRLNHLCLGDALLGPVQDDHLAPTPFPATQTDLATRLSHQVGLGNHAIGTLRNLADNLRKEFLK